LRIGKRVEGEEGNNSQLLISKMGGEKKIGKGAINLVDEKTTKTRRGKSKEEREDAGQ